MSHIKAKWGSGVCIQGLKTPKDIWGRAYTAYAGGTWLLTGSWCEKASCAGEESLRCLLLPAKLGAWAWLFAMSGPSCSLTGTAECLKMAMALSTGGVWVLDSWVAKVTQDFFVSWRVYRELPSPLCSDALVMQALPRSTNMAAQLLCHQLILPHPCHAGAWVHSCHAIIPVAR